MNESIEQSVTNPVLLAPVKDTAKAPDVPWTVALPMLQSPGVSLRELRESDASALFDSLTGEAVAKFLSPPPTTVDGFRGFVSWARAEQRRGSYACFAVVPDTVGVPVGLFQLRRLLGDFSTAEWGFALSHDVWGTGLFPISADLVLRFAFETLGVKRLEARAVVRNGRGNGALKKVGAVREGTLRGAFRRNGKCLDQALWSILAGEWQRQKRAGCAGRTASDQ